MNLQCHGGRAEELIDLTTEYIAMEIQFFSFTIWAATKMALASAWAGEEEEQLLNQAKRGRPSLKVIPARQLQS